MYRHKGRVNLTNPGPKQAAMHATGPIVQVVASMHPQDALSLGVQPVPSANSRPRKA